MKVYCNVISGYYNTSELQLSTEIDCMFFLSNSPHLLPLGSYSLEKKEKED